MDEDTGVLKSGGSMVDVVRWTRLPAKNHGACAERCVCRTHVGRMLVLEEDASMGPSIPADQTATRFLYCSRPHTDRRWSAEDGSKCKRDAGSTHQQ